MHAFIGELELSEDDKNALVSFLLSLTDERVRQEQAPFDHPQLFVPIGQFGDESAIVGSSRVLRDGFRENEEVLEIPAVGVGGARGSAAAAARHVPQPQSFSAVVTSARAGELAHVCI